MSIVLKRVYDKNNPTGGYRVLVDRIWPRGISKEQAQLDDWMKDLAPSPSLRKWFSHDPEKFSAFQEQYKKELHASCSAKERKGELQMKSLKQQVVLLYGAKDEKHNHAVVLKGWLESPSS